MKVQLLVLAALSASFAWGEVTVTEDKENKILSVVVPEGETCQLTAQQASDLNNNIYTNVVIGGGGTVTTAGTFANYTGDIHVNAGILNETLDSGLGYKAKCTVYIASGAILGVNIPSTRQIWHTTHFAERSTCRVEIASVSFFGRVILDGDCEFTGLGTYVRPDCVLEMNGHVLTAQNGFSTFNPKEVVTPGRINVIQQSGPFYGPYSTDHYGTNLVVSLPADATWRFQSGDTIKGDYTNHCEWTIECAGDLTMYACWGDFSYEGPIILPVTATLWLQSSNVDSPTFVLAAPISAGVVSFNRDQTLHLYGTNTIGSLKAVGPLYAAHRQSLPADLNNFTLDDWQPLVMLGSNEFCTGWSPLEAREVMDRYASETKKCLGVGTVFGTSSTLTVDVAKWDDYKFAFGAYGMGEAVLKGGFTASTAMKLESSTGADLVFTRETSDVALVRMMPNASMTGCYRFRDAGAVSLPDNSNGNGQYLSYRLGVDGATQLSLGGHLRLPNGANAFGGLEVSSGVKVSAESGKQVQLANNGAQETAYVRVSGGTLEAQGLLRIGGTSVAGLACVEVANGALDAAGDCLVAHGGSGQIKDCFGELRISGGEVNLSSVFSVGHSSTGVLYQTGGRIESKEILGVPKSYDSSDYINGNGTATFAGGVANLAGLILADRPHATGEVNLNGSSVVTTPWLYRAYPNFSSGYKWDGAQDMLTNYVDGTMVFTTKAYLNFNGGTLKAAANSEPELLGSGNNHPDRTTVFAGGACFDTNGRDVTISAALLKPEGNGIQSIGLPGGVEKLTGYFAPPHIEIVGDGVGATAVAEFDAVRGEVTGVTVTCPGWNYTAAKALIFYGQDSSDARAVLEGVVTLAANATTGGLVKLGAGTLTLAAANTYEGKTVVKAGTLKFGVADALPSNAIVSCEGGDVDVADGVGYPAGLTFDVSVLPYEPSTRYVLAKHWTGAAPRLSGLHDGWKCAVRANGNVVVSEDKGFGIIIR